MILRTRGHALSAGAALAFVGVGRTAVHVSGDNPFFAWALFGLLALIAHRRGGWLWRTLAYTALFGAITNLVVVRATITILTGAS